MIFQFGDYTLDIAQGCLRTADREVDLRPKSFEVLRCLVENAGRLVTKDELIKAVWPERDRDRQVARALHQRGAPGHRRLRSENHQNRAAPRIPFFEPCLAAAGECRNCNRRGHVARPPGTNTGLESGIS